MGHYLGDQAVKVMRQSRNLIPFPYAYKETKGAIFECENGILKVSGTLTTNAVEYVFHCPSLEVGKTYTYHINSTDYDNMHGVVQVRKLSGGWLKTIGDAGINGCTFTVTEDMVADGVGVHVTIYISKGTGAVLNATCKPMLNEGTEALTYDTYLPANVWQVRSGVNMGKNPKNLIPFPYYEHLDENNRITMNGITFTVQDDGGVKVEGTSKGAAQFYLQTGEFFKCGAGKPLIISGGTKEIALNLRRLDTDGNSKWFITSKDYTQTGSLLEGERIYGCNIYIGEAGITLNTTIYPMLNEGTEAERYFYYD